MVLHIHCSVEEKASGREGDPLPVLRDKRSHLDKRRMDIQERKNDMD